PQGATARPTARKKFNFNPDAYSRVSTCTGAGTEPKYPANENAPNSGLSPPKAVANSAGSARAMRQASSVGRSNITIAIVLTPTVPQAHPQYPSRSTQVAPLMPPATSASQCPNSPANSANFQFHVIGERRTVSTPKVNKPAANRENKMRNNTMITQPQKP
ncbi:MAG: hypothetical protein WCQ44_09440, partial [Opitutaceae bacterium]